MFGKIIGTGSYVPKMLITNEELSKNVETTDQWIRERTGVRQRYLMKDETTADMAVKAAKDALKSVDVSPKDIDVIVVSTVSSELILPNTACFVQEQIGAVNAFCFDINTACTGFMMAYNTVQSYIDTGLVETALIIGAEGLSRIVNWDERGTCILFGDGAGAAVIRKDEKAVFETVMKADGSQGSSLTCNNGFANRPRKIVKNEKTKELGTYIEMDGQKIFKFAVKQVPECINELMEKIKVAKDEIDMFVLHQANLRICQAIAKRLKVSMDKVPTNVERYGNTSSACIPILLDELYKKGQLKTGQKIVMSGFGAGVTLAATYLEV